MTTLYIDCRYGISGDMFVSALFDLGVDFSELKYAFNSAGIDIEIDFGVEKRSNISGKLLTLRWAQNQPLRTLKDILTLLERLDVSNEVLKRSKMAFLRLAEVEARVHNVSTDEVHFHEIGAIDTLWDIVASFWGLEKLEIGAVESFFVPWFTGEVLTAHGKIPLPAPATLVLLENKPVFATDQNYEMVTPTGALILDQIVDRFKEGPEGILIATGVGYGNIKKDFFNGLRVHLLNKKHEDISLDLEEDEVFVLESNIDHLTGEELGDFFDVILKTGALDVVYIPAIMKKNRPGGIFQVICTCDRLNEVLKVFFKHTLTLGIRLFKTKRKKLKREEFKGFREGEEVRGKKFYFDKKGYERIEFEDLKKISTKKKISLIQMRLKKEDHS